MSADVIVDSRLESKPAIVLLSGGLDSATVLAIAQSEGFEVTALTFQYGQRHANEVQAAQCVAQAAGVAEHRVVEIDLRVFGGSALTGNVAVPKDRDERAMSAEIPVTYVPARNTIFLSFALALAEARGAHDIFIGVNAVDYSGYPDCRPVFVAAFEKLANVATRDGVMGRRFKIHAPLMRMRKAEIIQRGLSMGVNYNNTRSCYDPDEAGRACGRCDSCVLRLAAFRQAGVTDPAPYQR